MFEQNAINFLRALAGSDPRIFTETGRPDPGWCCAEHALIAALAFHFCEIKSWLCYGLVMIGQEDQVLNVFPHWFVKIDSPLGIFDSSVTYKHIQGIPVGFSTLYPDLGVGYMDKKPTREDFIREHKVSKKSIFALYSDANLILAGDDLKKHTSKTPFGNWLTENFGDDQSVLWEKAALLTVEHLAGRIIFNLHPQTSRLDMWKNLIRSSDHKK